MNRHFGNPHRGLSSSDSATRERAATCFAIGFGLVIFILVVGGIWLASQIFQPGQNLQPVAYERGEKAY